ncbi:ATP-binding protein [Antribacter gilvus]|uniref:ATP-binding protein n=1 Tax=Antribacter gilvus TaxID=2304675 RepID=UPI000F781D45|nr:ATP-binding protein [Antribacter gilvus]
MNEKERRHVAAFLTPPRQSLAERRARRQALRALQTRGSAQPARTRPEPARYLPRAGEPGPAALRSPIGLRVPRHQDTSATWSAAYPFLAGSGLEADGVFIGQDATTGASFTYDPWVLYQRGRITAPNVVIAGIVGAGKSALAKALYLRSLAFGRRVYVPCDPKGEHTVIAEAVGGRAIQLGPGMPTRLNPLDPGRRPASVTNEEWTAQVRARRRSLLGALAETTLGRVLSPVEHTAIDVALTAAVQASDDVPVLPQVVDRLLRPDRADDPDSRLVEDGRPVAHALRRMVAGDLAWMFDGPSTVEFDPSLPMLSMDLSRVAENAAALSILMTCASAWMETALADPDGGQRWVVYDEAWRLMAHPALLRRMDTQWRLARHYGIANLLVFHKLTDLDNVGDQGSAARATATSLLANAETRIIYRQETDQVGPTAAALGLTAAETARLPHLGLGEGLWKIGGKAFHIALQLHDTELALFDTDARYSARA